jgi:alpha-galactosidase
MVNALLLRIDQSGKLAALDTERFELVCSAIAYYKTIRQDIRRALPFWPLGMPHFGDPWITFGLKTENKTYLAVWRLTGKATMQIPVPHLHKKTVRIKCAYPSGREGKWEWGQEMSELTITLPQEYCARLFEFEVEE